MRGPGDEASLPVSDSVCRPEGPPAHLVSFTLALLSFLLSFLLLLAFALLALLTLLALTPLHRTHNRKLILPIQNSLILHRGIGTEVS